MSTESTQNYSDPTSTDQGLSPEQPSSWLIKILSLTLGLVLVVFIYSCYRLYNNPKFSISSLLSTENEPLLSDNSLPKTTAIPTPGFLPEGPGDYSVSHPKSNGPTISRVIFDPLNIDNVDRLHILIILNSKFPIQSLVGELNTDNQTTPIAFTFKSQNSDQSQTWEATIGISDTALYKYILKVTGTNSQNKTMVTVAPRS